MPAPASGSGKKKGCLIAAAAGVALLVLIGIVVALAFTLTGPAVKSADAFLALLGEGKVTKAYKATAPAFQEQTDEETFELVVEKLGLNDFSSASWSSRSVNNDEAELEGTVTLNSGDEVPITMTLIQVGDDWKVFSISGKQAGVAVDEPGEEEEPSEEDQPAEEPAQQEPRDSAKSTPSPKKVPPRADLNAMAQETILALNQAVAGKNFTPFYRHISKLWQKQTTAQDLQDSFQSFIDNEVDMSGVADVDPVFAEKPSIDSDGMLNINGTFPTKPYNVKFELQYIFENKDWKLVSINVNLEEE
jgi:hypothetical protein